MRDDTIIFPQSNTTLGDIKRLAKKHKNRLGVAREIGIIGSHFDRAVKQLNLYYIFDRYKKKSKNRAMAEKVLKHAVKHGSVSAQDIRDYGWTHKAPSVAIQLARKLGHRFDREKGDNNENTWVYVEHGTAQKPNRDDGNPEFEIQTHIIKCSICGDKIRVKTKLGERPDPRRFCQACKERNNSGCEDTYTPARFVDASMGAEQPGEVKRYKPGDKEFERVAKECTPIKDIEQKDKKGFLPFF
jgi:hypothetical protein